MDLAASFRETRQKRMKDPFFARNSLTSYVITRIIGKDPGIAVRMAPN